MNITTRYCVAGDIPSYLLIDHLSPTAPLGKLVERIKWQFLWYREKVAERGWKEVCPTTKNYAFNYYDSPTYFGEGRALLW